MNIDDWPSGWTIKSFDDCKMTNHNCHSDWTMKPLIKFMKRLLMTCLVFSYKYFDDCEMTICDCPSDWTIKPYMTLKWLLMTDQVVEL